MGFLLFLQSARNEASASMDDDNDLQTVAPLIDLNSLKEWSSLNEGSLQTEVAIDWTQTAVALVWLDLHEWVY